MTRQRILYALGIILIISIGVVSYLYVNSQRELLETWESRNFQKEKEVQGLLAKEEEGTLDVPTYEEISHILRDSFSWSETVDELERIEIQLGLESSKLFRGYEDVSMDEYPIYEKLDDSIKVYSVRITFSGSEAEVYSYMAALANLEQTSILHSYDIVINEELGDSLYFATLELLYFIYIPEIETT